MRTQKISFLHKVSKNPDKINHKQNKKKKPTKKKKIIKYEKDPNQ